MRKCFASLIGESGLFPQSLYVFYISLYYVFLRQQLRDYAELFVLWIALIHILKPVCVFYWCCVHVLQWRNVLCLL